MLNRFVALLAVFSAFGFADVLTLRDGTRIRGQYLGGDARQIRMAVDDRIETYQVDTISGLEFTSQSQAGRPAVNVPPPGPPQPVDRDARGEEPRILRPDRDRDRDQDRGRQNARGFNATELPAGTALVVRMIDDVDSE